jgi:hypothetical protein
MCINLEFLTDGMFTISGEFVRTGVEATVVCLFMLSV